MLAPSGGGLILYQAYGNLYAMTGRKAHLLEEKQIPSVGVFDEVSLYTLFQVLGDGVTGIKRRRRDLYSDGVRNFATALGRGRLKEDLESSTWRRRVCFVRRFTATREAPPCDFLMFPEDVQALGLVVYELCHWTGSRLFEGDVEHLRADVGLPEAGVRSFEAGVRRFLPYEDDFFWDAPCIACVPLDAVQGLQDGLRGGHPREETRRDTCSVLHDYVTFMV
ncbi:hypothetical protein Tco_0436169 [Tanacetum coccineum]